MRKPTAQCEWFVLSLSRQPECPGESAPDYTLELGCHDKNTRKPLILDVTHIRASFLSYSNL